jgi:hypothetical protein
MSRYSGPQHQGVAREVRARKKTEAVERNWQTPDERRRWHRLGRPGPGRKNAAKTPEGETQ